MKNLIKKKMPQIIGSIIGGILGYVYYKTIGCTTGSCPITSNPYSSVIYGAVMGYLVMSVFEKK